LKKKESEIAAKLDKKKAAKTAAAATTPAPAKTVLNPNFVKIEGGESANQGPEKKQP
jgi:hypothetical protein